MYCHCSNDESLSEYVLVYVPNREDYVNHDWVKQHGVIVDFAAREHPLLRNHKGTRSRVIQAFTIDEALRLVEWEEGNLDRKPKHRVLDIDREVLTNCSWQSDLLADLGKAALERFMSR